MQRGSDVMIADADVIPGSHLFFSGTSFFSDARFKGAGGPARRRKAPHRGGPGSAPALVAAPLGDAGGEPVESRGDRLS